MPLMPFVPDQALVLVIVLAALALLVGGVRRQVVYGVVVAVILTAIFRPLVVALGPQLPWWLVLTVGVFLLLRAFRALANLVLGVRAADHMVGALATDVVRGSLRGLMHGVRWVFRI